MPQKSIQSLGASALRIELPNPQIIGITAYPARKPLTLVP